MPTRPGFHPSRYVDRSRMETAAGTGRGRDESRYRASNGGRTENAGALASKICGAGGGGGYDYHRRTTGCIQHYAKH